MKCPNCGEIIKEKKKMNFCGFCGANLKTGEKTFTAPDLRDNISVSSHSDKFSDFAPKQPEIPAAPRNNLEFGSPFERMVKENAVAQGYGGFQNTVTPPPFNNYQPTDFTMSRPGEYKEQVSAPQEPPIIPDTPSAFTTVAPPPVSQFTPNAAAPQFAPNIPVTPPPAPSAPAQNASPVASFDPSSLSMFDPYKMNNTPEGGLDPDPLDAKPVSISSYNERLSLLIEQTSRIIDEDNNQKEAGNNKPVPEAIPNISDPAANFADNITMKSAVDDTNANPITYMEYTRSADRVNTSEEANKFSSYSFTSPDYVKPEENTAAAQNINSEIKTEEEKFRKEEARKAIDESVDSILDFTAKKSSDHEANDQKPANQAVIPEETVKEKPVQEFPAQEIPVPEIPAPSQTFNSEPVIPAAPVPAPEPEVVKEKLISYIGQDKKAAIQMLKFKGMVPEIEYVDSEKDFGFVVDQSIPADSEVEPGTVIKLSVSAGTWSEWEENPMPVSPNSFLIETKTEYRKRSRTRTTDKRDTTDSSEYEGYTLTGTDQKYSDWEIDQYYTAEAVPPGPACEIVRVSTGFKYAGWFNPANMTGMSFSSPDVANFFNTNLSGVKWTYEEIISEQNIKPDVKNWKLVTDNMNTTPAGDPMISNIFFSAHVLDGKSYAMKFGSAETEWYVYKRRNLIETIYHFEKEIISDWGEWSEWAETPLTGSEDCEVESRTLTRSRRKIPNN